MFPFMNLKSSVDTPLHSTLSRDLYYPKMLFDSRHYAYERVGQALPYEVLAASAPLHHWVSDFEMLYQENMVYNLRLAAEALDGLMIKPGETFSFWHSLGGSRLLQSYRPGLNLIDGQLDITPAGGLNLMSTLLFQMFLHTPLSLIERHGQVLKELSPAEPQNVIGTEAIVVPGIWDLKVRNDTGTAYQIRWDFDAANENLLGYLFANRKIRDSYFLYNGTCRYYRREDHIIEQVPLYQRRISLSDHAVRADKLLYINQCRVAYELSPEVPVMELRQVVAS